MATLAQALRAAAARIAARPHADGLREARALVTHLTGLDAAAQLVGAHDLLPSAQALALDALVARREAGEPLARIIGRAAFWDFEVALNAATLVPRDDTGALVEAALDLLPVQGAARVVDLGTGSGIILLALARARAGVTGLGIDSAALAVAQARENAAALGLSSRLSFRQGNWLDGIAGDVDMIVSNPPYVRAGDMAGLADEVRDHDPLLALVAGEDGLDAYRAILPACHAHLRPGGHALFEIGHDQAQAQAVAALGEQADLDLMHVRHDLSGLPRVVVFERGARAPKRPVIEAGQKKLGKGRRSG